MSIFFILKIELCGRNVASLVMENTFVQVNQTLKRGKSLHSKMQLCWLVG